MKIYIDLIAIKQFYDKNIIHGLKQSNQDNNQQSEYLQRQYLKFENELLSPDLNITSQQISGAIMPHNLFYTGDMIAKSKAAIPKYWAKQHCFKTPTVKENSKQSDDDETEESR